MQETIFAIEIDYAPESNNLGASLISLGKIVSGTEYVSNTLAQALNAQVTSRLELQQITTGSIITWVRDVLEDTVLNIQDEQILDKGNKAFYRQLLIELRKRLVKYISNRREITKGDLAIIKQELADEASKFAADKALQIEAMSDEKILDCLDGIILPVKTLPDNQHARISFDGKQYAINKDIEYSRDAILEEFTEREIFQEQIVHVVVKKPDYIGQSKWDVYLNGQHIPAKILDENWLRAFQSGSLNIEDTPLPTDALKVRVNLTRKTMRNTFEVSYECEVLEVLDVVKHFKEDPPQLLT